MRPLPAPVCRLTKDGSKARRIAAVLPGIALSALKPGQFHRLPLPERYELCLAWSKRNAATRPALAGLIGELTEKMALAG